MIRNREQILTLPGGRWIIEALDQLADDVVRSTQTIGAITVTTGRGSPENKLAGTKGDVYLRTDGGAGSTLYIKETATDAAPTKGWAAK